MTACRHHVLEQGFCPKANGAYTWWPLSVVSGLAQLPTQHKGLKPNQPAKPQKTKKNKKNKKKQKKTKKLKKKKKRFGN